MSERILVISPRYWPEKYSINDICEGFVRRGMRVDVICGQPNYPMGQFFKGYRSVGHANERHGKVNIFRVPEIKRGSGVGIRVSLNYFCFSFFSKLKVKKMAKRKYKAVLVYQTSPVTACKAGLWIAKKQNIPMITFAVDIWPYSIFNELDMQSLLLRSICTRKSNRCYLDSDKIAVLTDKAFEYFTKELHIHPSKVNCIKTGPDEFLKRPGTDSYVLEKFAGSFNIVIRDEVLNTQDLDTIMKAGRMLLNAGIRDLKFIVVADVRPEVSVGKKAYKLNLGDMFFVERNKSENTLATYYGIADAFLSCTKPSIGEDYDYPKDIVNFISMGKPVIFVGDGEGKNIVRNARCGFVSDPEDAQMLFDNILKLYRTPSAKFREMGRNALEYQYDNHNNDYCVDALLEMMMERKPEGEDEFVISGSSNFIKSDDLFADESEEENEN